MAQGRNSSGMKSHSNKSLKAAWKRALALADHSELRWIPAILGVILASVLHVEDNWLNLIIAPAISALICLLVATLVYWIKGSPEQGQRLPSVQQPVVKPKTSVPTNVLNGSVGSVSFDDDFEPEEFAELVFELIRNARTCDEMDIQNLSRALRKMKKLVRDEDIELEELDSVFEDRDGDLSTILNDADFLEDAGPNATRCASLLELVQKYLTPFNDNFELVLATNPHIPESVAAWLMESEYSWEEDGTTQALARTTENPNYLRKLSESQENSTRYEVAANPFTPPEVLEILARDVEISDSYWYCDAGLESFIQVAVVRNPNTSETVLQNFLTDEYHFSEQEFVDAHGWSLVNDESLNELRALLATSAAKRLGISQ